MKYITLARLLKGLGQAQLARRLGISPVQLCRIEKGRVGTLPASVERRCQRLFGTDWIAQRLLSDVPESVLDHEAGVTAPPPAAEPIDWREAERRMILDALLRAKGHRTRAGKYLGWGRSTLSRKLKEHGITP
ncbi:MAG: helix-turn-helix domain-containing protein [Deltaproteobacteria bacterium]|nr:helix-turn-helix domain-containing protein [Deltaproteobacteria bacterium]